MPQQPDPSLVDEFVKAVRARIAVELQLEAEGAEVRRRHIVPLVATAVARARTAMGFGSAWLIGSYAWGSPSERSDVDVLVEGCDDATRLAALVTQACGLDVHVVTAERAPEALRQRALLDGVAL